MTIMIILAMLIWEIKIFLNDSTNYGWFRGVNYEGYIAFIDEVKGEK